MSRFVQWETPMTKQIIDLQVLFRHDTSREVALNMYMSLTAVKLIDSWDVLHHFIEVMHKKASPLMNN